MISLIFRSYVLPSNALAGRRRARTSCWVIVEAPRARPRTVSYAADRIAIGSKPAFCQYVLSSMLVVASMSIAGRSLYSTTVRFCWPKRASPPCPRNRRRRSAARTRCSRGLPSARADPARNTRTRRPCPRIRACRQAGTNRRGRGGSRWRPRGSHFLPGGVGRRSAVALTPRQADFHSRRHDSMGGLMDARTDESRRRPGSPDSDVDPSEIPLTAEPDRRGLLAELRWRGLLQDATPGLGRAARERDPAQRVQRLRPDGHLPPRRPPRARVRAAPPPAARQPAGGGRRRRDGDDRRSVRPFGRARAPDRRDDRRQRRALRVQLERFLDFRPGPPARSWSTTSTGSDRGAARLPARHRQALHRAVHARQGLGPDPAPGGPELHRVQLHAAPGRRLPAPVPRVRRRGAAGRRRPVGQHHRRPRADPARSRAARRSASASRST